MSHPTKPSLIGSIIERKAASHSSPTVKTSGKTGFPTVQHRSQSAFSRARNEQQKGKSSSRPIQPPPIKSAASHNIDSVEDEAAKAEVIAQASDDWRRQMEEENQRRVENMSPEELEAARREIIEQFGPNIGEILRESKAAREAATGSMNPLRSGAGTTRPRIDSKLLKSALSGLM